MNTKSNSTTLSTLSVILAIILGIVFLGLALMYWLVPAGSLPSFMPGFESGVTSVHFKHGLGSLILALALFAFAWFKSGKNGKPELSQKN